MFEIHVTRTTDDVNWNREKKMIAFWYFTFWMANFWYCPPAVAAAQNPNELMCVDGLFDSFMCQRFAQNWNYAFELCWCCLWCAIGVWLWLLCAFFLYTNAVCILRSFFFSFFIYIFWFPPEFISFHFAYIWLPIFTSEATNASSYFIRRTYRVLFDTHTEHEAQHTRNWRIKGNRFFNFLFLVANTYTSHT